MQELAHKVDVQKLYSIEPHLFDEQFEFARWLVVPMCTGVHWILAIADLQNVEILMFNSLSTKTNLTYQKMVAVHLSWVKYFLSWRFGKCRTVNL